MDTSTILFAILTLCLAGVTFQAWHLGKEKRDVVLMVAEKETMRGGYQINLYGEKGWRSVTPDLKNLYAYLLEAFLDLVITGKESVPVEEEVEVIAALEAAKRSLELGREVKLNEVMKNA